MPFSTTLFNQLESSHLISTRAGLEHYWETGQYGTKTSISEQGIHQHFQYVHDLLRDSFWNFNMDILPDSEHALIDVEVIDRKIVCLQKVYF